VAQLKYIVLSTLILFIPFQLIAEEEGLQGDGTLDETSVAEVRMLRQVGDVVGYQALDVAGEKIDAAYIEETLGERHGAVILLHDDGEQFESHGVVTPLRHALPDYGWSTLTLSFNYPFEPNILLSVDPDEVATEQSEPAIPPAAVEGETSDEDNVGDKKLPPVSNQQRMEAALTFLQGKGIERIVFIGHGAGAELAINLLDRITVPISALVLVGATALPKSDVFNEFNFPIFDVYGTNDLDTVPMAVKHRSIMMKRIGNDRYETRRVLGADHVFSGLKPTLTATVSGWLRKRFVEKEDN